MIKDSRPNKIGQGYFAIVALFLLCNPFSASASSALDYLHIQTNSGAIIAVQQATNEIKLFQIPTANSGPNAIISSPNDTFWFVEFISGKLGEFFVQNE